MAASSVRDGVKLNVGGKTFETSMTTLARAGTDSPLYTLARDQLDLGAEISIDGNPEHFGVLLDLLRTGHLDIPQGMAEDPVYRQAKLYGLEGHIRAATRGSLNGNLLRLSHSVMSRSDPPGYFGGLIRASPDGGFCVAHIDVVRTYNDWNLKEEHPPVCCGGPISDVVWCDARNIAILTDDDTVGLFDTVTGELSHCFNKRVPSKRTTANLCMNSSSSKEIFRAYALENHATEVGAWDLETGKLKGIVTNSKYVCKLLWISGINCLLQASEGCRLRLVDPRTKQKIAESGSIVSPTGAGVADLAVNEMSSNICLMDGVMNLGFLDYRKLSNQLGKYVPWMSRYSDSTRRSCDLPETLLCHEGQLFAKREHGVYVFAENQLPAPGSGFSRTWRVLGSRIRDISIGGDRLFVLHTDAKFLDVVTVWETPRPSSHLACPGPEPLGLGINLVLC